MATNLEIYVRSDLADMIQRVESGFCSKSARDFGIDVARKEYALNYVVYKGTSESQAFVDVLAQKMAGTEGFYLNQTPPDLKDYHADQA